MVPKNAVAFIKQRDSIYFLVLGRVNRRFRTTLVVALVGGRLDLVGLDVRDLLVGTE